jgi:anaerobic magnesium-protoporphyrin IX monomethyl ester cyclase
MKIALVAAELEENLSIRYLWGALAKRGHEVVLCRFDTIDDLPIAAAALVESNAGIAAFSMVFTYRAREFAEVAREARAQGFKGHIVAGGHFAAFNAERLLGDCPAIDSIAIGEGERIVCDLAECEADPQSVAGLVRRAVDGRIVRNAAATPVDDLDTLDLPERKLPYDEFLGLPIVNMLASRGCMHGCAFCSIAAWHKACGGKRHRFRSVKAVAAEMADLYGRGVRIFNFHDDNFLPAEKRARLERVGQLREALDEQGVGRIAFAIKARPDEVDEELFGRLCAMGLFRVFLGIEAGTAASLKALGRGQSRSQNEEALRIVNKLGLHACFNLLLLNPESTLDDVLGNIEFLKKHPDNPMNFCRTEIYAGTPLERRMAAAGRLIGDYWGYDYEIADDRVEKLFRAMFPLFHPRCYGENALHHLVMAVDYEYRLLAHFFLHDGGLKRRVKKYVADVNSNTCEYLERMAAIAGDRPTDAVRERALYGLRNRLDADTARLTELAGTLLNEIRAKGVKARYHTSSGTKRAPAAAAVGLAAVIAIAGCGEKKMKAGGPDHAGSGTKSVSDNGKYYPCEVVPPPPDTGKASRLRPVDSPKTLLPPPGMAPRTPKEMLLVADSLIKAGDFSDAERLLVGKEITDGFYSVLLGKVYMHKGRFEQALERFDNSLTQPNIVMKGFELRNEALYSMALSRSELYKLNPSEENKVQLLYSWQVVKRMLGSKTDDARYKRAEAELEKMQ